MKISKISTVVAMALGGLVACATVSRADDTTPAPATPPPAAGQGLTNRIKGGAMRGNAGGPVMEILKKLDLNDEQKEKVRDAMKGQQAKMAAIRQDTTLSRQDKMAKIKELRDGMKEEMKKILTAEQYAKYEEEVKKMMPMQRPGGPGAAYVAPGAAGSSPAPAPKAGVSE